MARNNPTNPYTRDPSHTQKDVPMPIQKAKVLDAKGMPDESGFHTVKIQVYGDDAPYIAPVVTPMFGSVWVPREGTDVAVTFGNADKPWVIGAWYPLDRADEDGDVDLPDYEPGDLRLGNESGSHVTIHDAGAISIITDGRQPVNIDHQSATALMSTDQSVAGDDTYDLLAFDTAEDDPEGLFDSTQNGFVLRTDGTHEIAVTVEIPSPGQNNRYTLSLFRNGSVMKRKSGHSVVNQELSLSVDSQMRMDATDVIDVRLKQNSGSSKTVNSSRLTTEFSVERRGI